MTRKSKKPTKEGLDQEDKGGCLADSDNVAEPLVDDDANVFMRALNMQRITESSTISVQTNVNCDANAEYLLRDAHNLYFSHIPRLIGTGFRFQVGELAYAKWRGELNLVVIHFVSQKLVTSPDDAVEYSGDEDEESSDEETDASKNYSAEKKSTVKQRRRNDGHSPLSDYDDDPSVSPEEQNDEEDVSSFSNDEENTPNDSNEQIFVDPCTKGLYAEGNTMRPLQLRCDENEPLDPTNGESKEDCGENPIKQYLIPIYFVTFPGYKKRCARTFRFWVKEKDLIKYRAVKRSTCRLSKSVLDIRKETDNPKNEPLWVRREIEDIDEYVYKVVYNTYQDDLLLKLYNKSGTQLPWCVPPTLQQLVAKHQKHVLQKGKEKINLYSADAKNAFTMAPLTERLSAYALVQNFKYVLIYLGTFMRRPREANPPVQKPETSTSSGLKDSYKIDLDDITIPSLRILGQMETTLTANITAPQFQEIYINNIYWLDLYIKWIDTNFLDLCCYNEPERQFIFMVQNTHKRPLSRIVGLEHLARLFCFQTLYEQLLSRIYRQGQHFAVYLPITQLLIHYMAFVASDYTHNQNYTMPHIEGEFFKFA